MTKTRSVATGTMRVIASVTGIAGLESSVAVHQPVVAPGGRSRRKSCPVLMPTSTLFPSSDAEAVA